jgi:hypothetical protein
MRQIKNTNVPERNKTIFLMVIAFLSFLLLNNNEARATENKIAVPSNTQKIKRPKNNVNQDVKTAKNRNDDSLFWNLKLSGTNAEDQNSNQKSQFTLSAGLKFDKSFSDFFKIRVNSEAKSTSGYIQSQESEKPEGSQIRLKHGSADLFYKSYLGLSAGALNQQETHSSLLVDDRAFPAIKATAQNQSYESNGFAAGAHMMGAVPTSTTLSNEARDKETTPSFASAGFKTSWSDPVLKAQLQINSFQYKNIPLAISTNSAQKGNSVRSISQTSYEFTYQFEGLEALLEVRFDLNKNIAFKNKFAGLKNNRADETKNQGYSNELSSEISFDQWTLIPSYTFFRVESDAAIADYNDSEINTNRVGYKGGLALKWKQILKFSVNMGERTAILESLSQPRDRFMSLNVELLDAKLF